MNEALKRLVWERAGETREYCRLPQWLDVLPFQIDHPRQDAWDDHFAWVGPVLTGRTAAGRTTVDVPGMSAPERVELRWLLMLSGLSPAVQRPLG
jgi:hypothetical protein